jgi:hypothetical protein
LENRREVQVLPGGGREMGVAQIMYTHASKCSKDKIIKKILRFFFLAPRFIYEM